MPRARTLALCIPLLLAPGAGARAQDRPIDPAELQAFLDREIGSYLAKAKVPGAVVSVVQDGRVLLAKGYGWSDGARKIPVSPESTLFPVGSLSKPVTATAVLQLAERGRLRLDEDVNRYLSGFELQGGPGLGRPVTAADLLTHTGGLDVKLAGTAAPSPDRVLPLGRYLARELPPRVLPPGRFIAYSNHGYTLLGHLVERASGLSFARYMEANVFLPLGMRHSTFAPAAASAGIAQGYEPRSDLSYRLAPPVYPHITPAAGLVTTADDMARFLLFHLDGDPRVLSPAALAEMHRQRFTQDPRLPGMAYGFFESYENAQRTLFHGGGIGIRE